MSEHEKRERPPKADLLYGAKDVAEFLGVPKGTAKHLMRAELIPTFKLGDVMCARKTSVTKHLDKLEGVANGERR